MRFQLIMDAIGMKTTKQSGEERCDREKLWFFEAEIVVGKIKKNNNKEALQYQQVTDRSDN